jgi:Uma2 family endonuclease
MTEPQVAEVLPWLIDLSTLQVTRDQFVQICRDNPDLKLELTAEGELLIMTPTGISSGVRNSKLTQRLGNWAEEDGTGISFDSSTMYTVPNGAQRSPDASWMRKEKYDALSDEEKDSFARVVPDFVIELRSPSDNLRMLQKKMEEYISVGVGLGFLIDPVKRRVHIYRPDSDVEVMDNPETVSGDPELQGFVLNLTEIW